MISDASLGKGCQMSLALSRIVSIEFIKRTIRKILRELVRVFSRWHSYYKPTLFKPVEQPKSKPEQHFKFLNLEFISQLLKEFPDYPDLVKKQAQQTIDHRFNLLGSGWVRVVHGMSCSGIHGAKYPDSPETSADPNGDWLVGRINQANLAAAQSIWRMADERYVPIDWQLDFKSGYRWRESTWHQDIRFQNLPGVDVKVPWELARMQHLPTLAMASHFANADCEGFQSPAIYVQEFRNQMLDFIATNPPGFGVNWACAMDVAIRVANMLVAHDIFTASGAEFDTEFVSVFYSSVTAHAKHIVRNLEWSPQFRGNHYLANIVGLLFAANYLPSNDEVDAWLAFSVQELISEVAYQFHEDGSNFEASVCYHRLSAEMVLWAFTMLSNLSEDKRSALTRYKHHQLKTTPRLKSVPMQMHAIPASQRTSPVPVWCWERLLKMQDFTKVLTRPDGLVSQIGDNDSGRFMTLGSGEQLRANNDPASPIWSLDHGSLMAGINALLLGSSNKQALAPADVSALLISALADIKLQEGSANTEVSKNPETGVGEPPAEEEVWRNIYDLYIKAKSENSWTCVFPSISKNLRKGLKSSAFTGMGCYVFQGANLYLAVRCGELGLAGLGAHAHCDQLGIELVMDGRVMVHDPGTYLYTPSPDWRNRYRSAVAHHVPRVPGREPADLKLGPFDLRGAAEGECLYFGERGFIGRHHGYGSWVYRIISIESDKVVVHDFSDGDLQMADPTPANLKYSQGYGLLLAESGEEAE